MKGTRMSIAQNIRTARDKKGLSQVDAARELYVTNVHLCNCESSSHDQEPSLPLLKRMAILYGTTLSELLKGE